jgi:APA family basic amino acid/polyamine antiporter
METSLNKKLNFWDCMGFCIGQIIGSGIMVLTGVVIGFTGHGTPYAFILAGVYAIMVMLPSAVLASAIPASGAGFTYVKKLIGEKAGFFYLTMFVLTQVLIATFAKGFGSYFVSLFPSYNENVIAIAALVLATGVNIIGLKTSAKVQKAMVAFLMMSLLLFVVFGLPKVDWSTLSLATSNIMPNGFRQFMNGIILLSFAAGGAKFVAENGGDIENPGKTIPKAMIVSTISVCIVYAFVGIVASGVLPVEQVAFQNLTLVAKEIFPTWLYVFFTIGGAMFALLTTLNGTLGWVTRGLQAAAKEGWLPEVFAKENKGGTPVLLLGVFFLIGAIPILTGLSLETIANMGIGLDQLCEAFILIGAFQLPKKFPKEFASAPFTFKKNTFYGILVVGIILRFGAAYIDLSSLEPKMYIAIGVYLAFAWGVTNLLHKNMVAKKERNNSISKAS